MGGSPDYPLLSGNVVGENPAMSAGEDNLSTSWSQVMNFPLFYGIFKDLKSNQTSKKDRESFLDISDFIANYV